MRGTGRHHHPGRDQAGITPACAGNRLCENFFFLPLQDHPRVCGEQSSSPSSRPYLSGSPPRVRGTGCVVQLRCGVQRITPACAGNRVSGELIQHLIQDHPRVCGEQSTCRGRKVEFEGSPPRVRGTALLINLSKSGIGITPACAGNSDRCFLLIAIRQDHPRVCGEQLSVIIFYNPHTGSPPRVRGTGFHPHLSGA